MASASIAVIGAGPAGLAAAERLSAAGHPVAVYDRMPSPARKFLMAGRGGLNLTHSEPLDTFLQRYGEASAQLEPALRGFTPEDLRAWAAGLGQPTFVGSSGRVFPESFKASPLLRAWLARLEAQGVRLHPRHAWEGWTDDGRLAFTTPQGPLDITADATVLALGGASWPRLGADGGWVARLRERGVTVHELTAANMGVNIAWSPVFRDRFAGTPLKRIALACGADHVRGEAVITTEGLEGGVIYALSRAIRTALRGGPVTLLMDLRPDLSLEALTARLAAAPRKLSFANLMRKSAGLSLGAAGLVREAAGEARPTDPATLARFIKAVPLPLTGTAGIARAISSAGGIAWEELRPNYELKRLPGVFACGEMLDWDAPTGGYLLQGCFSTGHAAAKGVLARLGDAA